MSIVQGDEWSDKLLWSSRVRGFGGTEGWGTLRDFKTRSAPSSCRSALWAMTTLVGPREVDLAVSFPPAVSKGSRTLLQTKISL